MAGGTAEAEELSAKIAGQEISVKSFHLNTLASVAGVLALIPLSMFCWFIWQSIESHRMEAKAAGTEFVAALKEQTLAMKDGTAASREQTCLLKFDQKERQQNAPFCEQISGVRAPR